MTTPGEVRVAGVDYLAAKPEQVARLLTTSHATTIPDPRGGPVVPGQVAVVSLPAAWAQNVGELRDALELAGAGTDSARGTQARRTAGAVASIENRLVSIVEEVAQLLGISRSFAYEAVQRGEIPSMRIGRRILVPKVALERFLSMRDGQTS